MGWCGVGWGGVGWGGVGMMTFLAHVHIFHATFVCLLRKSWWGVLGWGGVKFLHIERKITSLVHSHPPSHYICKHVFLPTT